MKTKISFRLLAGLAALLGAGTIHATDYYIAPGGLDYAPHTGSSSDPWRTLDYACTITKPGDTVYLKGGTYTFPWPQTITGKGYSGAYVRFKPVPGDPPVIVDCTGWGANTTAIIIKGHWAELSGIEIYGASAIKNCVAFIGSSTAKARGLRVSNCKMTAANSAGVLVLGSDDNSIDGVVIDDCEISNCVRANSNRNATSWTPAVQTYNAKNVTVTNCVVHNNYGEGIGFAASSGGAISHNTVYDNYSVNVYIDTDWDLTIDGNYIYTTHDTNFYRGTHEASGLQFAGEVTNYLAHPLSNLTITNNVVANCYRGFFYSNWSANGGGNMGMANCTIANNAFYSSEADLIGVQATGNSTPHTGNVFTKNIMQQTGTYSMSNVPASPSGFTCSYNDWYGGTGGAHSFGDALTDSTADPKFLNPGISSFGAGDYMLDPLTSPFYNTWGPAQS